MFMNGTTTLEGKSGYGLTMESELRMLEVNRELNEELPSGYLLHLPGRSWLDGRHEKEDYIDLLCKEMIPRVAGEKLAVCNDIWCDEGHYTAKNVKPCWSLAVTMAWPPESTPTPTPI